MQLDQKTWEDALKKRHGEVIHNKLSHGVVAICGLGGLGSNIAITLARAGIGKLILIDYDRVDVTNLHRQQYKAKQVGLYKTEALYENLKEIAPFIDLEIHNVCITEDNACDLLREAQIVCEAFDLPDNKAMLANVVLEAMPDKYLVAASGMAGIFPANTIKTRRISDRFYLCGDEVSDVLESGGLYASRVTLCAAHQAHAVLRILAQEFDT